MAVISDLMNFGALSQASYADLQTGMFSSTEENLDTDYIDLLDSIGVGSTYFTVCRVYLN